MLSGLKDIKGIKLYSNSLNGIAAFEIEDMDCMEVTDIMSERYNIALRAGLHCAPLMHNYLGTLEKGLIRASLGWNNAESDVDKFLTAIEKIATR
jgi:selenocysteine lyase/cysteine desulfurase